MRTLKWSDAYSDAENAEHWLEVSAHAAAEAEFERMGVTPGD
jgi:hypothetical protein